MERRLRALPLVRKPPAGETPAPAADHRDPTAERRRTISTRVAGTVALLALGGAIGGYLAVAGGGTRRPVAWQDITGSVSAARWARPTISVIRDRKKLDKLFLVATFGRHPTPPRIDFARREAVLVTTGPRSSTGYSLRVESVTEKGGTIDVLVRERTPSLGQVVAPRLTYPLLLITLLRSGKHVHVRYAGRS